VTGECSACTKQAESFQYHDMGYFCQPCIDYTDNEVFAYHGEEEEEEEGLR